MATPSYFSVCKQLIQTELFVFKKDLPGRCIDLAIWATLNVGIMAYVMPYFGLSATFGVFQFGGILAACALFELYANVVTIISDLQGNHVIDYQLTLPIPSWMALISRMCAYAITYIVIALIILPVGKILLWQQFDVSKISLIKLLLAIIMQALFFASFVFLPASLATNISHVRAIWARFIFPMWFLGGFQFSWTALHSVFPKLAYLVLLNPMMYITEMTRVALIGQEGFINFWICLCMLLLFSALSIRASLYLLKKKLDYV